MAVHETQWMGFGRKAQCAPDPAYPAGIDVDLSGGAKQTCTVALFYPAPECGVHVVECKTCGFRAALTAAGRPDDPRTVRLPCRSAGSSGSSRRKHRRKEQCNQ